MAQLVPHADWSACLSFAQGLSEAIERMDPDSFTTAYAKRGRRNKILLDYLRNNRTNTSVAAYSSRAREHAPVSVPIAWDELRRPGSPSDFTVATVPQRLSRLRSDPWGGYWRSRQKLTQQRLKAVQSLRIR